MELSDKGYNRKLVAILSADAQDYTRLMGEDENATVRAITSHFETMSTLVGKHRGKVVDSSGDNLLAEFSSVVDAVQCAAEIQETLKSRNERLPEDRRMVFRIGINLGDVIEEGGRLYGDGVNVASRIERLADGGEICISGTAYDHVRNKLPFRFEDLGKQTVKNLAEPVRAYKVLADAERPGVRRTWLSRAGRWKLPILTAASGVIVAVVAVALWNAYLRPTPPGGGTARETPPGLPLPDVPSIAVLPFENLTGDPGQDYLSDGFTDDIITSLSTLPRLFVISRTSTFNYKVKPVKVQQVSRELGVRYVLEGSIQKAGKQMRVTAQLIDATTGSHVWGDRYDRDIKDIFKSKDELVLDIAGALAVSLTEGDQAKLTRRNTGSLAAWQALQRGQRYYERRTPEDMLRAREQFQRAVALDPKYVNAWVRLGFTYFRELGWTRGGAKKEALRKAAWYADRAMELDPTYSGSYMLRSWVKNKQRRFVEAMADGRKAVELEPNNTYNVNSLANHLLFNGQPEDAIVLQQRAMRLSPFYPPMYQPFLGLCYYFTGQCDKAVETLRAGARTNPTYLLTHILLAVTYAELGREEEMGAAAAEVFRLSPGFTGGMMIRNYQFRDPAMSKRLEASMKKAGFSLGPDG